jgi:hypothetical protein
MFSWFQIFSSQRKIQNVHSELPSIKILHQLSLNWNNEERGISDAGTNQIPVWQLKYNANLVIIISSI